MGIFLGFWSVTAALGAFGAYRGQMGAIDAGRPESAGAVSGAGRMPFVGVAFVLLLVSTEIPYIGFESFAYICCIWFVYGLIFSVAAEEGARFAYAVERPRRAALGAFVCCLLVSPLSFFLLILLTAF